MFFSFVLFAALSPTVLAWHAIRAAGSSRWIYVDRNTNWGCEAAVIYWLLENVDLTRQLGLAQPPPNLNYQLELQISQRPGEPAEVNAWLQTLYTYIYGNVRSFDVRQTGPKDFSFSCAFHNWTFGPQYRGRFLLQLGNERFRMQCPPYDRSSQIWPRPELYGRIDHGVGVCDLYVPIPSYRPAIEADRQRAMNVGGNPSVPEATSADIKDRIITAHLQAVGVQETVGKAA